MAAEEVSNRGVLTDLFGSLTDGHSERAAGIVQQYVDSDLLTREPPFLPWGGDHHGVTSLYALFEMVVTRFDLSDSRYTTYSARPDASLWVAPSP